MKIAFIWTGITSYMASCWRQLAAEKDVELKVWIDATSAIARAVDFNVESVMQGVACEVLRGSQDLECGAQKVATWQPEVLFVVGWRSALSRAVVLDKRLKDVPKVCAFDMPWRWQLRCLAAPFVLGRFLRNYRAAFVPGAICARYAKWLGFKKIYTGLFAIDTQRFRRIEAPSEKPYFLYIGRNSAEKRVEDIRAAHRLYRKQGGKAELKLYGKGLEGGFVKPEDIPALMHHAAAFVLASSFDPWPLVLLEAMAAACPIIASNKCTNYPELGKNWHIFKCGDVAALAHEMLSLNPAESARQNENVELAQRYDCQEWVRKVRKIIEEIATC